MRLPSGAGDGSNLFPVVTWTAAGAAAAADVVPSKNAHANRVAFMLHAWRKW
jgi:hypothetical protein